MTDKRAVDEGVDAILDDAVNPLVRQIAINVSLDGEIEDAPLEGPDELKVALAELIVGQLGRSASCRMAWQIL